MPETKAPPAALTIAEAAKAYSVSAKTIRAAIRSGALVAKNISEGGERLHARIAVADLQAWFANLPDA